MPIPPAKEIRISVHAEDVSNTEGLVFDPATLTVTRVNPDGSRVIVGGGVQNPLTADLAAGGHSITGLGAITVSGLTGASAPARFVGGTVSGAPGTGTFAVGDFIVDQSGTIWVCTIAGTPGTWLMPSSAVPEGRAQYGAGPTKFYKLPGVLWQSEITMTQSANRAAYAPFMVKTPITIAALCLFIVTPQAGSHARIAIYNADTNWQPTTLVIATGAVSTAAGGQLDTAIAGTVLPPGRYLTWINVDTAGIDLGVVISNSAQEWLGFPSVGQNVAQIYAAQAYAAAPGAGLAWDTIDTASGLMRHHSHMVVSIP